MTNNDKLLVFTGGHHTSSLLVATRMRELGWQIAWFGRRHSLWGDKSDSAEYQDVTRSGIKFYDLLAGKLYRTYHPLKLLRLPLGFLNALFLLLLLKPKGIVSFGGYLAVPSVTCGWLLGIPSLTHEQTTTAGWANKLISLFTRKIAVAWPDSSSLFPKDKTVLTGLPLRPELFKTKFVSRHSPKPGPKTLFITGGKQGSHLINQTVFLALPKLANKFRVIHQTGSSTLHNDYNQATKLSKKFTRYFPFTYDSSRAVSSFHAASVVVSRAGAHTIYELAVLGIPCVLIPITWASHNEQLQNARILSQNHQAIIIPQEQLNSQNLISAIDNALKLRPQPLPLPRDGLVRMVDLINQTFK